MPFIRAGRRGKRTLLHRGKKHMQKNAGTLVAGVLVLLLLLWTMWKFFFTMSLGTKQMQLLALHEKGLPFPQYPVDIWPFSLSDIASSATPRIHDIFFPSCLPNRINDQVDTLGNCQAPNDNYRNVLRIQTTPTVTGQAVANLVGDFLLSKPNWEINIRTFSSQPPPDGWIVHIAVLPPLLEAMDLLLHVQTEEDEKEEAWKHAIEYTIQRILRHHCEFATAVKLEKAVWSISLNEVVGFPSSALRSFNDFLDIQEEVGQVSSSAAALTVLERIHYITEWFEKKGRDLNLPEWDQWVNGVIESSIHHVTENHDCNGAITPPNELAKRVDSALLGTLDCAQYPSIGLCSHIHN